MLKWNLELTTRLAYGVSLMIVIFFWSAFSALAGATGIDQARPFVGGATSTGDETIPEQEFFFNGDARTVRSGWEISKKNQDAYVDRWQERKRTYRLWEEYGAWLRDHQNQGSGTFGSQGFLPQMKPYTMPLPTFFDIFISVF